jgi:hypothetical protein
MFCRCNFLMMVKELSQGINTTLVFLSLQTSSSVRRLDVCRPGMNVNHKIAIFKAVPSLMMQHQDSFGTRTRFLLVLMKQSWERLVLSSGFMPNVSVKSRTIMVIMASSLRRSFGATAKRSDKVSHSLALVPNTRMPVLNVLFRPSCIWRKHLWFTPPFIGQKEVQTISLSLVLVWVYNCVPNVRSGLTPLELITRESSDYKDLLRCHVWGCLVFVLEANRMTRNFPSGSSNGSICWFFRQTLFLGG